MLLNIINNIKLFKSKDDLRTFSKKVEAENILGIKSKVRPKKLLYRHGLYSKKDYEEI
jgi:hypothetical protein